MKQNCIGGKEVNQISQKQRGKKSTGEKGQCFKRPIENAFWKIWAFLFRKEGSRKPETMCLLSCFVLNTFSQSCLPTWNCQGRGATKNVQGKQVVHALNTDHASKSVMFHSGVFAGFSFQVSLRTRDYRGSREMASINPVFPLVSSKKSPCL